MPKTLAALLAHLKFETLPTVDNDGKLMENANPWARQCWDDIQSLDMFDE